jgi:SCF-associated factor 1
MQAECGWSFSSILTQSGDVLVFWPSSGEIGRIYDEENAAMDERGDCNAYGTEDHRIPCVTWPLRADPLRIPSIPQLPDLESTGLSPEERLEATTLIKIAAFDNHLIGLTNKGHVLKFGDLSNEHSFDRTTRWQYVSHPASALCSSWHMLQLKSFSELSEVAAHPAFRDENTGLQAPTSLRITHVRHGTFLLIFLDFDTNL